MNKNTKDRSSADNGDKDLIIFFLGLSVIGAITTGITKILLILFDPIIKVFLIIWGKFMEQDNR